jgi:hypothetical protein
MSRVVDGFVLAFCVVSTVLMIPVAIVLDVRDQLRG